MQGEELKGLRKVSGMTQAQFAEAIGITTTWLGQLERGEKPISDTIKRAAQHVISPIQYYTERHIPPEIGNDATALLNELAAMYSDEIGEVAGIIRLRTGELLIGMRRTAKESSDG